MTKSDKIYKECISSSQQLAQCLEWLSAATAHVNDYKADLELEYRLLDILCATYDTHVLVCTLVQSVKVTALVKRRVHDKTFALSHDCPHLLPTLSREAAGMGSTIYPTLVTNMIEDMAESKQRSGTVIGDLAALLESGYDSDVTLVAGDARIEAHRLILSARSPVFAAKLRCRQQEACLEIPDTEKDVLRQLLRFIYTDEAPELARMAPQLLVAADKYDLQVLKDRCEQQLVRDICVENAAAGAVLAVQRGCPALRRAVVDFIRSHSVSVMGTPGWADALHTHPKALAQVSRLVAGPAQTENRTPLQGAGSSQEIYRAPRGPEDLASRRVLGEVRSKAPLDGTQTPDNSSSREKSESSSADSSDVTDWFAMRMAKASGPKPSSLSAHTHTPSGESKFSGKPPTTEDRPETNNKSKLGAETHQTSTNDYPWWYVPLTYNPESSAYVKSSQLPPKSLSKPKESLVSMKSISVEDLISNDELPWWRDVL